MPLKKTYKIGRRLRRLKSTRMPINVPRASKLVPLACEFCPMEKRLTWTVPIKLLSPNVQLSWHAKYSLNSRIKKKLLVMMPKEINQVELPCRITLIRIGPRKFDYDNVVYCFKMIRDFIADYLRPGLAPGQADADESLIKFDYGQENAHNRSYGIKIVFQYEKI